METTRTPTENASLCNPRLEDLREMADALLQAFKAASVPKDHTGIGTAARTLISLTRLIKAVYDTGTAAKRRQPTATSDTEVVTGEVETDLALTPVLNRKQRRREDKFRRSVKIPDRATAMSPYPIST